MMMARNDLAKSICTGDVDMPEQPRPGRISAWRLRCPGYQGHEKGKTEREDRGITQGKPKCVNWGYERCRLAGNI